MSRGLSGGDRLQDFDLFVADRFAVVADGRLHRQVRQHLEHVVFDHVADGAGFLVKVTAPLDAEVLGHRDLHAFDIVAVPDRFEKRVLKAEVLQVPHGRFAQVVVDAEDRLLRKGGQQDLIEALGRFEIAAERLFDDHAAVLRAAGLAELLDHDAEHVGRDGEVKRGRFGVAHLLPQLLERGEVGVVAVDVAQELVELVEGGRVEAAVLFETVRARSRNWSRFQFDLATPITGTFKRPRLISDCSEGKIFL